jgi:peptidyl-prolyl cis-trans isomerase SurA
MGGLHLKRIARALLALVLVLTLVPMVRAQSKPATPAKPSSGPAPTTTRPTAPPAGGARAVTASTGTSSTTERLDGIAAVVNDDVVLESDVEEQLYLFLMRAQQQPDSALVDTLRKQILNQLIDEKLIVSEAKRQGVSVTSAEVEKEVDGAIADAKQRLGGDDGFRQQLQRENTTEDKLRERYRSDVQRQQMAARLVNKQVPRKPVTAAEAEAYFKSYHAKFPKMPGEVKVQVIQIPPEADSTVDKKARIKIAELRKRVVAGEKFAKVASEQSEDPNTARSGGDLGFLPRGALDRDLDEAAFTLKLNELSPVLRSAAGWHVLQVLERDTVRTASGRDSLDRLGHPALEAHVRHILVRVPVDAQDVERARALAQKVRAQAVKGGEFGDLVRRYSKYDGQATPDGDIGFISLGTLSPSIRAGLEALQPGQISEVLENTAGFNVFKMNDKKAEREYELSEIRTELPEVVAQMKQRERYEDWLKGLRSKAHIEIRSS